MGSIRFASQRYFPFPIKHYSPIVSVVPAFAPQLGARMRSACRLAGTWDRFNAQGNTFAVQVHRQHGNRDSLIYFDDISGIPHESISQLADVHQAVLMDPNVHEGPEGGTVGN